MVKEAFYLWGIIGAGLGVALYMIYKDMREFIVPTIPLVLFLLLGSIYRFVSSADGLVMLGGGCFYLCIDLWGDEDSRES